MENLKNLKNLKSLKKYSKINIWKDYRNTRVKNEKTADEIRDEWENISYEEWRKKMNEYYHTDVY